MEILRSRNLKIEDGLKVLHIAPLDTVGEFVSNGTYIKTDSPHLPLRSIEEQMGFLKGSIYAYEIIDPQNDFTGFYVLVCPGKGKAILRNVPWEETSALNRIFARKLQTIIK